MKPLPRSLSGLVVAVGFVLGAYIMSSSSPVPSPQAEAPRPEPRSLAPGLRHNEDLAEQVQNAELRRKAKALEQELQALRAQRDAGAAVVQAATAPEEPEPVPWPENVPEAYTPHAFEAVARSAAAECGMGLDVLSVDCSEFPCIAWTKATDPNVRSFSMAGCAPWDAAFENGAAVIGSIGEESTGADGGVVVGPRYFAWMAVPPNPADMPAAFRRARWRTQELKESLGLK